MADVSYVSRRHLGSGNYEWTYKCRCDSGDNSLIKVASGNQMEAGNLAQLDCEANCGEAKANSLRHEFASATRSLRAQRDVGSAFNVWVNEVTDDAFIVTLCSGDEVVVPRAMVKRFRPLGFAHTDDPATHNTTVRLELDESAPGALTVIQLAKALEKQLGACQSNFEDKASGEVCQQVKVNVSGMACDQKFGYYISPYPITGYALASAVDCQVKNLIKIGQTQLRFVFTGPVGTPCSNSFGGKVYLDVCWVQ